MRIKVFARRSDLRHMSSNDSLRSQHMLNQALLGRPCKGLGTVILTLSIALLSSWLTGCTQSGVGPGPQSARSVAQSPIPSPPSQSAAVSRDPCPSARACIVSGDGGVVRAINQLRKANGLGAVRRGRLNHVAEACALGRGRVRFCPRYYAWSGDATRSVGPILQLWRFAGGNWMLSPQLQSLTIAWAYFPSSADWVCVAVVTPTDVPI
jgi:hypothetical protein